MYNLIFDFGCSKFDIVLLFRIGTGTATAKVISDIRAILRLDVDSAPCIMGTFNRTNISYEGKLL